jgi:hypothetical protein
MKSVMWRRNKVCCCSCRYDWRDAHRQEVQTTELMVSWQVHQLCKLPGGNLNENTSVETNPLLTLGLEDFFKALIFIATYLNSEFGTKGRASIFSITEQHLHKLLSESFTIFQDWPNKYYRFIESTQKSNRESIARTGLKKDFGGFYPALYKSLSSPCFEFMRSAFQEYVSTRWAGGYAAIINRRQGIKLLDAKYVPKYKARKYLKVGFIFLEQLIESGDLEVIVKGHDRKRVILIEKSSLERLKAKYDEQLSLNRSANVLGVGPNAVVDLVRYGCLKAARGRTVDEYPYWRFSYSAIQELLSNVKDKLHKTSVSSQETIDFRAALKRVGCCRFTIGRFIKAILDGEISPCKEDQQQQGLRRFLFNSSAVSEYAHQQLKKLRGDDLSVSEVRSLLRVGERSAYFLVKKGILPTRKVPKHDLVGALITKESLEYFTSTYEFAAALAKRIGTVSGSLIKLLADTGIHPISGPRIDGGLQYIYKKSDLQVIGRLLIT